MLDFLTGAVLCFAEVVQDFFDVSVFDTGSGGWYRDRSAVPEGS